MIEYLLLALEVIGAATVVFALFVVYLLAVGRLGIRRQTLIDKGDGTFDVVKDELVGRKDSWK